MTNGEAVSKEIPWEVCTENVSNIAILLERSNHQGDAQIRIEKDIDGIHTKIGRVEGKIDALTIELKQPILNKKQIGGLVSAVIIIAQIASTLFDKLGW